MKKIKFSKEQKIELTKSIEEKYNKYYQLVVEIEKEHYKKCKDRYSSVKEEEEKLKCKQELTTKEILYAFNQEDGDSFSTKNDSFKYLFEHYFEAKDESKINMLTKTFNKYLFCRPGYENNYGEQLYRIVETVKIPEELNKLFDKKANELKQEEFKNSASKETKEIIDVLEL